MISIESTRQSLRSFRVQPGTHLKFRRGKSGLHRAECQVMPGGRESTESAAERRPPMIYSRSGKGERVR